MNNCSCVCHYERRPPVPCGICDCDQTKPPIKTVTEKVALRCGTCPVTIEAHPLHLEEAFDAHLVSCGAPA